MLNVAIMGCGKIANRIAIGIKHSKGNLYACASRDIDRAKEFAEKYDIEKWCDYEGLLNDDEVDLVYIATINPTHEELIRRCILHGKHVICEKPMVESRRKVEELFDLAKENKVFLMDAHKTCFIPLNQYLKSNIDKIGKIIRIDAERADLVDRESLNPCNRNDVMGGCFYDIGSYPTIFSLFFADSDIKDLSVSCIKEEEYDVETVVDIEYENGIRSNIKTSWLYDGENKAIIVGDKGTIEIEDYWKGKKAIVNGELIEVSHESDFTGEVDHALECIEKGLLESPVMSRKMNIRLVGIGEEVKRQ